MASLLLVIIYIAFISLGLPDSVIGSIWPIMHNDLNVPVSYAGLLTLIISISTIGSSLLSDYINSKFKPGHIIFVSVLLTGLSLLSFSFINNFYMLCIFSIPYGFGAGCIDATLNNYVANNYKSKHMNWLHAMWGIGASIGPFIMGLVLTNNFHWHNGFLVLAILQIVFSFVMFISLPLWKKNKNEENEKREPIPMKKLLSINGLYALLLVFIAYCALEQSVILWASTYFVENNHIDASTAAFLGSLFVVGITVGRIISGFLSIKFNDKSLIRFGFVLILISNILIMLNLKDYLTFGCIVLMGLGCAPIYPCMMHAIPIYYGKNNSQAIIGLQMASAYIGVSVMPFIFGFIASNISVKLLPYYLFVFLVIMVIAHEVIIKKHKNNKINFKE